MAATAALGVAAAPHARAAAAVASPPPDGQPPATSNDGTAQWRVWTDVGRDLAGQGRQAEAEAYLRRALEAARRGFGADDPHVASACNNLGELYRLQRRYDEAEPLYREARVFVVCEGRGGGDGACARVGRRCAWWTC